MKLLIAILLVSVLVAQTPGIVNIGTTVTATAGTGATAVVCVMTNPSSPTIHTVCSIGGTTVLTQDATPMVASTSGAVGSFSSSGNTVTWLIQQPAAGNVTWQIAANGTSKSGTF